MEWGWDNARAVLGLVMIVGIAWGLSENRKAFPWKIVLGAVGIQFIFALLLFAVPPVRNVLFKANVIVDGLENATRYGTGFVFGYIGDNTTFPVDQANANPAFFFQILPIVIVVAALSAILWHWRILRWITKAFAFIFAKTMGLGGATSLAVSANIFMGMTEAPVLVKPYIKGMTRSEIFVLMTTGFATIAGSVLIIYTTFLSDVMANPLAQLLTASIIAAPAAVALALTMVPETTAIHDRAHEPDFEYESTMDAFSSGASTGLQIVLNIATMLIAALALLFMVNAMLGGFSGMFLSQDVPYAEVCAAGLDFAQLSAQWVLDSPADLAEKCAAANGGPVSLLARADVWSIQRILGLIFSPLMYMVGVPMNEAATAGSLMGIKTVLTEFVAFLDLAATPEELLSDRSRIITAHAICGFANFGSIGILIGGLTIIAPERRDLFLQLSWKTLISGTLATCMSACVAGALPASLFTGG